MDELKKEKEWTPGSWTIVNIKDGGEWVNVAKLA